MNITELRSAIERKTETKNLDFKRGCDWSKSNSKGKLELVKDMLAMANTQDGGSIILGVEDSTYELIGLTEDELKPFDQTKVNDFYRKYTEPLHTCQVIRHEIDGHNLVELAIPEFVLEPIICSENGRDSSNSLILQEGALYIRTDKASSEVINNAQEMRSLLRRASVKDSATIIRDLERILQGRPDKPPEDKISAFKTELEDASIYIKSRIGESEKDTSFWRFEAYPNEYNPKLIDISNIREVLAKSVVALRGWDYPHIDRDSSTIFQQGFESTTTWVHEIEAWRLYQSGLFVMESVTTEEMAKESGYGEGIDIIVLIYILTEYCLFISRLANQFQNITSYHLSATLNGISGLSLRNVFNPGKYSFFNSPPSKQSFITVERESKTVDLISSPLSEARELIKEFFSRMNAQQLSTEGLEKIQQGLMNRTF